MSENSLSELDEGEVYLPVNEGEGIFEVGDRIRWCEGCYGQVVFVFKDMVGVVTDDGISRLAGEKYISKETKH